MTDYNKPNTDAANEGSLTGQLDAAIRSFFLNEFEGMLPAKVISYSDQTNRAVVKPLVMIGTTDGGKVSRARVAGIPVYRFGGGGFFMRFPIKPGDLGWIKANDRDISLIFQRGGLEDWPNTTRLHKFSDAMFFPDTFKDWVINGANADAAVWQSLDGLVTISLHADKVRIESPTIELVASSNIDMQSPAVNIASDAVAITGASLTHNGINVGDTHQHIGSPTAPLGPVSNTGTPIP